MFTEQPRSSTEMMLKSREIGTAAHFDDSSRRSTPARSLSSRISMRHANRVYEASAGRPSGEMVGPKGFTNSFSSSTCAPGSWRFVMHGRRNRLSVAKDFVEVAAQKSLSDLDPSIASRACCSPRSTANAGQLRMLLIVRKRPRAPDRHRRPSRTSTVSRQPGRLSADSKPGSSRVCMPRTIAACTLEHARSPLARRWYAVRPVPKALPHRLSRSNAERVAACETTSRRESYRPSGTLFFRPPAA